MSNQQNQKQNEKKPVKKTNKKEINEELDTVLFGGSMGAHTVRDLPKKERLKYINKNY